MTDAARRIDPSTYLNLFAQEAVELEEKALRATPVVLKPEKFVQRGLSAVVQVEPLGTMLPQRELYALSPEEES